MSDEEEIAGLGGLDDAPGTAKRAAGKHSSSLLDQLDHARRMAANEVTLH